jgi:hypothetical protein
VVPVIKVYNRNRFREGVGKLRYVNLECGVIAQSGSRICGEMLHEK